MTKISTLLTSAAIVSAISIGGAFAQDTQRPPAATPMPPASTQPMPPAATAPAPVTVEKFIAEQKSGEFLASDLIGLAVYNSADEKLGSLSDLIVDGEGKVVGALIGVGGFLGIGAKEIGVSFASLDIRKNANGADIVVFSATKEELDSAAEFKTLADLQKPAPATAPTGMPVPSPAPSAPAR